MHTILKLLEMKAKANILKVRGKVKLYLKEKKE
jgi:hypothetical protein